MDYVFQFGILKEYAPYLAGGLGYTCMVGFGSIFFSIVLGLFFATLQISNNKILKIIALIYVDIFRTVPLVCLLIWIHYVMPILFNVGGSPTQSSIIALSLNGGALACEAFRGGLEAIPLTQNQASLSLGFSRIQTILFVIIPQAVYSVLPPLTNVFITNLKNVTITMIVSVPEVMFRAQELTVQFFRPLELYTGAAIIYILLIGSFSYAMRRVEKLRKWESI
ncbi:MAG: amino acid ABC transporter permease [Deltaproteobacteria bacterium]|jgi:His/Glu/Gln/Arg/opine family amino acid ABC transporter permease subunit|nr:amino acid ABC transporter permease [Deltaproteobacteria bacterium]